MDVGHQYEEYWKRLEKKKLDEERKRIEEIPSKLRERIRNAVERNLSDALLLSGIYSGILAYYLKQLNPEIETITVGVENVPDLIDFKNAKTIVSSLELKHHNEYRVSNEQVSDTIPKVIRILKTFDSNYLPNDLVIYFGLEFAQRRGIRSVMTGEGANELFAGHTYTHPSNELGDHFPIGMKTTIEIRQPYPDAELNEFVPTNKIEESTLRKSFADVLPHDMFTIVYRRKFPIEQTSGLAEPLKKFMKSQISDRKAWWEKYRI